jgi:hypothetical protein
MLRVRDNASVLSLLICLRSHSQSHVFVRIMVFTNEDGNLQSHDDPGHLAPFLSSSDVISSQVEHVIGPILGALLAGFVCLKLFPDDPASWKRGLFL